MSDPLSDFGDFMDQIGKVKVAPRYTVPKDGVGYNLELRCWPAYFQAVWDGRKPFDVHDASNNRRLELIEKKLQVPLTAEEEAEYLELQRIVFEYMDKKFPRPHPEKQGD